MWLIEALVFILVVSVGMAVRNWREAGRERVAQLLAGPRPAQIRDQVQRDRVADEIPLVRRLTVAAWQAGVAVSGENVLVGSVLAAVMGYGLLLLLTASPLFAAGGLVAGVLTPYVWLQTLKNRRAPVIGEQLPQALRLWAQVIRSGRSVKESLALAAHETPAPLGPELLRAVQAMSTGYSPEEAMRGVAERLGHPDMRLVVSALRLHAQLGGSLADPLNSCAQTAQERVAMRKTVAAKTAFVRGEAYMIMALPAVIVTVLQSVSHAYFKPFLDSPRGVFLLGVVVVLILMAVIWLRGVVRTTTFD